MKINRSLRYSFVVATKKSPVPEKRAVDQSPVGKQYKALNGFYHTDLHMLRLASDRGDKSLFDALSSRLQGLSESPNGKTIQQLFDEWKPLYIQTPCETSAWLEYLHNNQPDIYERLYGDDDRKYEEMQKNVNDAGDSENETKSE